MCREHCGMQGLPVLWFVVLQYETVIETFIQKIDGLDNQKMEAAGEQVALIAKIYIGELGVKNYMVVEHAMEGGQILPDIFLIGGKDVKGMGLVHNGSSFMIGKGMTANTVVDGALVKIIQPDACTGYTEPHGPVFEHGDGFVVKTDFLENVSLDKGGGGGKMGVGKKNAKLGVCRCIVVV